MSERGVRHRICCTQHWATVLAWSPAKATRRCCLRPEAHRLAGATLDWRTLAAESFTAERAAVACGWRAAAAGVRWAETRIILNYGF